MSWRKSKTKIGGRKAVEHLLQMDHGTHEVCIAGRAGEVWQVNKTTYRAIVTSSRIANGLAASFNKASDFKRGDEMLITFGADRLSEIIKAIKAPVAQKTQIKLAEKFGK